MAGNPFTSAQAPAAMQMLAPDIATQQTQLARQQQLADMLRQQALQPDPGTQVINGWAVRKSPLEALGRMATALMATKGQSSIEDRHLALAKAMQGRMSDVFDSMAGGSQGGSMPASAPSAPSVAQPAPQEPPQASGATTGAGLAPQPAPAVSQIDRIRNQAKAAYLMGNTDLANKLLENVSTLTNEQKNMAAMGQDPLQMGRYATAAARKGGIIELQPGTTALDLSTGQERFQPKVGEGISLNGGVASAIPGYAGANAEIAGASAGATAGAQAQHKLITVNTPNGPVMMTEEQAAQLSGGGGAQQSGGVHFNSPAPGGVDLNFKGNPQAVFDRLSKLPEPDRTAALQAFGQYAGQPSAPSSGQVGIPLKTPAQEAQELADVKARNEPRLAQNTKEATDMADYKKALDGHLSDSQALLQRIAQSREALTKFRAGGGGDTRVQLAQWAQAIPGMPTSVVDKIAGGDLSAAQEFQKYAAQEALGTMQQALASDTGKGSQGNRIAMQLFIKNNPNLDTDPRAIEKIFNFQTQLHDQIKAQSDAYQKYVSTPGNNPSDFPNWWATEAIKRGFVKPEIKSGYAKGIPPNVQAVLDKYK
jgi:hypothetical protein